MLTASNISKIDQEKNPEVIMEVLQCFNDAAKSKQKYMTHMSQATSNITGFLQLQPVNHRLSPIQVPVDPPVRIAC